MESMKRNAFEMNKKRRPRGMDTLNTGTSDNDDHAYNKASRALARLICVEEMPPQVVEDVYFRDFMNSLNPQFQFRFDTIEANCLEIYKAEKEKIKEMLKNLDGQISLSVDILRHEERWGDGYDYLCLRAHFIDDSWKVKNWVLNFRRVWYPDEVFPNEAVLSSLEDWDIENKISTITMTTIVGHDETMELVKNQIHCKKELQVNGKLFCVYCCGDVISLVVQAAFDEISEIIDTVTELNSFWKSLPLWYLKNHNLKEALKLEAMGEFSSKDVTDHYDVPSADEWNKVKGVCELVDRVYKIAKPLFHTKHPTANIYFHHLREIQEILTQAATDSDGFIRSVAEKMLHKFVIYWKDMFLVLAIAAVMDPRCKMEYIKFSCSKFENRDDTHAATVLEAIHNIYDDYVTLFPQKEDAYCDSTSEDPEEDSATSVEEESGNSIDDFFVLQSYQEHVKSTGQLPKAELDLYLEEPVLSWTQDFSALSWWKANGPKYPTLSRMARDFLAIPVSVATSYEAFYMEERKADERMISLKPELMNALMCTRSWSNKSVEY